jgi:hypothetical protein
LFTLLHLLTSKCKCLFLCNHRETENTFSIIPYKFLLPNFLLPTFQFSTQTNFTRHPAGFLLRIFLAMADGLGGCEPGEPRGNLSAGMPFGLDWRTIEGKPWSNLVNRMIPKNPLNWRRSGLIAVYFSSALVLVTGFGFLACQSAEPAATPLVVPSTELERPQTGLAETQMVISGKTYRVEVASTPQQEQTGLMYRKHLPKGHGMLFPFSPSRRVSFWMKNTKMPLDMLYLRM